MYVKGNQSGIMMTASKCNVKRQRRAIPLWTRLEILRTCVHPASPNVESLYHTVRKTVSGFSLINVYDQLNLPNPVVDKYPTLFLLPTDPCFIMSRSSPNARAIMVSALTAAIISTTAVFLRLLSKYWTKKPGAKADDYWIVFATLSFWAYVSVTLWGRCL